MESKMGKTFTLTAGATVALLAGIGVAVAGNAPGVTDTEIKIGNTNPYSGPVSGYSTIGKAIAACFKQTNAEGGINGRKIKFISYDDGYSPPKTKEQTRKLVEKDKVALIFQGLGTPTNSAIHKYMNKKGVPQLFVATGATKWGQPKKFPWTMGFQPNYQTIGRIFGNYILQNHPNGKVAVLYQNDDYGKDYVIGVKQAMGDKYAKMVVKEESYEVTDPTVASQIISLKNSGADVFVNISVPKFAAQAIKKMDAIGWKPTHLLNDVAATINGTYKQAGFEKAKGVISLTFQMDPNDSQWDDHAEMKEWRIFMKKYYPKGDLNNQFNVYGWSVCGLMINVLERAGNDLSRANIMKMAASFKKFRVRGTLPGIVATTTATDFYPVEQMQMMRFDGKNNVRFGPLISAESTKE
jgi:branched-chain amino acid transport system substrate-binding protein